MLSVVKSVANLKQDFTGVQVVRSTEGETVIQQHAAVCDINPLKVYRQSLAKTLADGQVKRCVRLKVVTRSIGIPVGEARRVVNICRRVTPPGKVVLPTNVQGIPLVVIEQSVTIAEREVGQAAIDVSETEGQLV